MNRLERLLMRIKRLSKSNHPEAIRLLISLRMQYNLLKSIQK